MNIVLFVFLILIYIISIVLISFKLRDILKKPHKYEEIDLENRAYKRMRQKNFCRLFKSLSHQYSMVSFMFVLLLTAMSGLLIYISIRVIAQNNIVILPGTWLIGVIAMFFLNIIIGMVIIPLNIKTTFFAVAVDDVLSSWIRYDIWKKGYILFLIFFIIAFPFFTLSSNNYIHYNDDGITNSAFFEISETYTPYEDIEEIWISAHHNKHGDASSLNYEIKLSNGKILELCTNGYYNEKTLDVHKKIEAKSRCKITVEPLTDEDIAYLTKKLSKEKMDIIQYIFDGFH